VAAVSVGMVQGTPLLDLEYTEDSACDTDMNVVMTGRGGFVEVQGTAEGAPFTRAEMDQLLALADKGIRELVALQKAALAQKAKTPCACAGVEQRQEAGRAARAAAGTAGRAGAAGRAGHRRSRRAAPHLHRERAGQGAPCRAASGLAGVGRRLGPVRRRAGRGARCGFGALCAAAGRRHSLPTAKPAGVQDAANNALLLQRLQGQADRRAAFVSTLVAVRHAADPEPLVACGRWAGEILPAPRGEGGFGYDPLMFIPELGRTVAELDAATKNRHSHRARRPRRCAERLREAWHLG
jgi:hypothetical protein